MRSLDNDTKEKIRRYVKKSTDDDTWETNADAICHLIENGKVINGKAITYDDKGNITSIKGTEVKDGVLQLKEKKQSAQPIIERSTDPIPFVEDLRKIRNTRRRLVIS